MSRETHDAARTQLMGIRDGLPDIGRDGRSWQSDRPAASRGEGSWYPSVRFALEQALAGLERPAGSCLEGVPHVKVNALLDPRRPDWLDRAASGYASVKLKVGQGGLDEDVRNVSTLRGAVGEDVELRLDANRAWPLEDAVRLGRAVARCHIAYVEEPVQNVADQVAFTGKTGIPVGLDETLADVTPETWLRWDHVGAIIVKPMLLQGLAHARLLLSRAAGAGITPVVSSCYETGVGLTALAELVVLAGATAGAHGLDTWRQLQGDVLTGRIDMDGGRLDLSSLRAACDTVNPDLLEPVP